MSEILIGSNTDSLDATVLPQTAEEKATQLPVPVGYKILVALPEAEETFELTGPVVKFSSSEVLISGVTNIDRVMNYANILRFVLTSDSSSIDQVCPRRVERVEAMASVIPQAPVSTITLKKSLLDALADLEEDEPEPEPQAQVAPPAPVEEL
jgi:hypothetical protein